MSLPESIPVRYTEEEAGYVSMRPIVRQTFQLDELLDMILSVTGKDAGRVRKILHSGTVVYHFFRYSWAGFDVDDTEIRTALARFPDPEPSRKFSPMQCSVAIFESGGAFPKHLLELDRMEASKRRIFRRQSFWDRFIEIVANGNVTYQTYSYGRRADIYKLDLNRENVSQIADAAREAAPAGLRFALHVISNAVCILLVCPRQ